MQIERVADEPWAGFAEPANDACLHSDASEQSTPSLPCDPDRWIVSNPWLRGAFTRRLPAATAQAFEAADSMAAARTHHSRVVRSIRFFLGLH
jgi:hypothetical protein